MLERFFEQQCFRFVRFFVDRVFIRIGVERLCAGLVCVRPGGFVRCLGEHRHA